jgi:hypothetical protein
MCDVACSRGIHTCTFFAAFALLTRRLASFLNARAGMARVCPRDRGRWGRSPRAGCGTDKHGRPWDDAVLKAHATPGSGKRRCNLVVHECCIRTDGARSTSEWRGGPDHAEGHCRGSHTDRVHFLQPHDPDTRPRRPCRRWIRDPRGPTARPLPAHLPCGVRDQAGALRPGLVMRHAVVAATIVSCLCLGPNDFFSTATAAPAPGSNPCAGMLTQIELDGCADQQSIRADRELQMYGGMRTRPRVPNVRASAMARSVASRSRGTYSQLAPRNGGSTPAASRRCHRAHGIGM